MIILYQNDNMKDVTKLQNQLNLVPTHNNVNGMESVEIL